MRYPEHARAPLPPVVRYSAVSVALLVGFFTLLVAAAHPGPVAAAVGGVLVGLAAGRARRRVESYARRLADAGEEAAEPNPGPV